MINKQPIILPINGTEVMVGHYNHSKRTINMIEKFFVEGDKYEIELVDVLALNMLMRCTSDDGDIKFFIARNIHDRIEIQELDDEEVGSTIGMNITEWFNEKMQSLMV